MRSRRADRAVDPGQLRPGGPADAGRAPREASEAAQEAIQLADRVRYPVCEAVAIEAAGVVGALPGALADLKRARDAWQDLSRPLEATRCELLLGQRLLEDDREAAILSLERAASEYDELGVGHLAMRARELAAQTPLGASRTVHVLQRHVHRKLPKLGAAVIRSPEARRTIDKETT